MQYNGWKSQLVSTRIVVSRGTTPHIQIAAEIAQCNYNVRQFKKVHHSKHLKICQPQKNKIIARLSTEPNPIRQNNADVSCSSIHARTLTDGLDKTLRFNSTFIPPQNSKTKKPFFSKCTHPITKQQQVARISGDIVANKKSPGPRKGIILRGMSRNGAKRNSIRGILKVGSTLS